MKIAKKLLNAVAVSLAIYFGIALTLIYTQSPVELSGGGGLDFSNITRTAASGPATQMFNARDGAMLERRIYPGTNSARPLLILIHGSGWHGMQFDALAPKLRAVADVVVPDLRGHGVNPKKRGDLDYFDQLEDDIADLIALHRRDGQKVILAGHSSGGGLVVRFAGGRHGTMIDGAVLMAPFLKYNAPTTRPNSGGWAHVLTRRIIGLTLLNNVNVKWLNHKIVIQFNFPQTVLDGPLGATATTAYSYRFNRAFAPRDDYLRDVAALPKFLLIVGDKDEAFVATAYAPLMSEVNAKGRYVLVKDVGHLDIVNAQQTEQAISAFIGEFNSAD